MDAGPFVVLPGEGREIPLGAFTMSLKATAEQTGGAFSLLEASEPPGFGPPMHIHHDSAEAFYVLEGEYTIFYGGDAHPCRAGSFVYIPAGVEHTFLVGSVKARKLNLYAPAAMVGYFDELSAAEGTLTAAALAQMALRHGMEVTGPVPEGYA
jgi:mannose-6-phosphate isomerase-like protein (cupin superfamily)